MADWATISALATAGGTLALAGATFAATRSGNRSARIAEQTLLAGLRPLLMPSRPEDPPQKVGFADDVWLRVPGGGAVSQTSDDAVYVAISVRNAGSGIAVLHGWRLYPELRRGDNAAPEPETFTRLTRDLYVAAGDVGFWQGTFRDPAADEFAAARAAVESRQPLTVDILYGDYEGGQRVISRFALRPKDDGGWLASVARHWNVDRPAPR